jgi:hypothetical protein
MSSSAAGDCAEQSITFENIERLLGVFHFPANHRTFLDIPKYFQGWLKKTWSYWQPISSWDELMSKIEQELMNFAQQFPQNQRTFINMLPQFGGMLMPDKDFDNYVSEKEFLAVRQMPYHLTPHIVPTEEDVCWWQASDAIHPKKGQGKRHDGGGDGNIGDYFHGDQDLNP